MVIIEGMDNSGKSTLAQILSEEFHMCLVKTYQKPSSTVGIYKYDEWLESCPQRIIMDRHPMISDFIYGRVLRGFSYIDERISQDWSKNHLIIYCRPSEEIILDFGTRNQMKGVVEQAIKLLLTYDMYMETISHIRYDFSNYGEITNAIRNHLQSSV